MIDLKRVVVATDFGDTSAAALRYGVEIAAAFGASLHVLHVVTEPLHDTLACSAPGASFLGVVERFRAAAREHLESLVRAEDLAAGGPRGHPVVAVIAGAHAGRPYCGSNA